MFILVKHKDCITLPAARLAEDHGTVIEQILGKKYCNKVLMREGLSIGIYDITRTGVAEVRCGKGTPELNVEFRVIVFGPWIGEILTAEVCAIDEFGVRLTMGFTSDIIIPAEMFHQPAEYIPHSQSWDFTFMNEAGEALDGDFTMQNKDKVTFRVQQVLWGEDEGKRNEVRDVLQPETQQAIAGSPMVVIGAMNEQNLGPSFWWN